MVIMVRRVIAGHKYVADSCGKIVKIVSCWVNGYRISGALHPFIVRPIGNAIGSTTTLQGNGNIRAVASFRV